MPMKSTMRKKLRKYKFLLLSKSLALVGRFPVHFLHIGKTGGTAIKEALGRRTGKKHRHLILLHPHSVSLWDIPRGDKVVFFVRDPISRFISGFYSRQREGRPRYRIPWAPDEAVAFKLFETPNQLAKALSSPDTDLRNAAIRAMHSIRHVNSHYHDWLVSKEYLLVREKDILFIGQQETLNKDFGILKDILGLPSGIELPMDPTKAHKSPNNVDKTLDNEAIQNLRSWYCKDYEIYETCLILRRRILKRLGCLWEERACD